MQNKILSAQHDGTTYAVNKLSNANLQFENISSGSVWVKSVDSSCPPAAAMDSILHIWLTWLIWLLSLNARISLFFKVLIRIARAEAVAARQSTIMICVLQTEEDLGFYESAINSLEANKESVVTFGPWKGIPSTKDLLDCVRMDIERWGYTVSIQPHIMEKGFLSRSYDYFYKVIFTWWW